MKKILTKILAIALICVMTVTSMGAYDANYIRKELEVKIVRHPSYLSKYTGASLHYRNIFVNARKPFDNKWNIFLSGNSTNDNIITASESCSRGYELICNTINCGSTCVNHYVSNINDNHHKNIYAIENELYNMNLRGSSDLQVSFLVMAICNMDNGIHKNNVVGLGSTNGRYSIINKTPYTTDWLYVRIMQHEFSHNFGCSHHAAIKDDPCIMAGGFDDETEYDLENIWCSECQSDFNRNLF